VSLHNSGNAVTVPSGFSRANHRSTPITAPPPRRGRIAAAIEPTWRRSRGAVTGVGALWRGSRCPRS